MSARDIEGWRLALLAQLETEAVPVAEPALTLLCGALTDLNRIADALEVIALNTTPGPR